MVLTPVLVEKVVREIRAEVARQLAAPPDVEKIEEELKQLRSQAKNLVRMGALAGENDIPELAAELRKANERVRSLETELRTAQRLPAQLHDLMLKVEAAATAKIADLRTTLSQDRDGAREVFRTLFPDGLTFNPEKSEHRRVFALQGRAKLAVSKLSGDPTGT